jgi:predicted ferric reductase
MDFILPLVILGVVGLFYGLSVWLEDDDWLIPAVIISIVFLVIWSVCVCVDVRMVSDLKAFHSANAAQYIETVDETLAVTDRAKGDKYLVLGELAFWKTGQEATARIAEKRDAIVKYNKSLVYHRYANECWWVACFLLTPAPELELIKVE